MNGIRERLRKAIDRQRALRRSEAVEQRDAETEAAFRPVREAADELRNELADIPAIRIEIQPIQVGIGLYDKHLWFGYDREQRAFIGSETDTLWMEGGIREKSSRWESAEDCVEAMIQACARYVALADAIRKLSPRR